ncbi:MFS transporter [Nonomuraea dietziae]|uniref:MFS transporter n=1 Tax=Nonomuraea dietziae TaxID=65515 RepID=UPI0031DFF4F0
MLGTGPALTGLMFLPLALGVVAGSVLAIKLGYRLAPRTLLVIGGLLTGTGFAWFGLISPDGTFTTDVLGPSIVASVGFGLCLGPLVSIATTGVARHESGTASGLLNSSRQIGASLGLAVLGTVAHHRTGPTVTPRDPQRRIRARPDPQRRAPGRRGPRRPHRPAPDQSTLRGCAER